MSSNMPPELDVPFSAQIPAEGNNMFEDTGHWAEKGKPYVSYLTFEAHLCDRIAGADDPMLTAMVSEIFHIDEGRAC